MSPRRRRVTTVVLIGVSGVGKSSTMAALQDRLGWPALEGDSVHPASNVRKMAAGVVRGGPPGGAPWLAQANASALTSSPAT